jgi:heme/copper-type cytochrome/quinol oxidase subunit 3
MGTASVATPAAHEEAHAGRPLGWYGMVFFIASEAVFFANLIAAYLYLRLRAGAWPSPADASFHIELNKLLVGINTVILLSSSIPMHFAGRAAARGNRRGLAWGLFFTIVLGLTFLSIQLYEYTHSTFGPRSGVFGSTFFTLTGFHGAHVTAGALFLIVCLIRTMRGDFTAKRHFAVQAAEMYWHFVDVVWVVLFTVLYLITPV